MLIGRMRLRFFLTALFSFLTVWSPFIGLISITRVNSKSEPFTCGWIPSLRHHLLFRPQKQGVPTTVYCVCDSPRQWVGETGNEQTKAVGWNVFCFFFFIVFVFFVFFPFIHNCKRFATSADTTGRHSLTRNVPFRANYHKGPLQVFFFFFIKWWWEACK